MVRECNPNPCVSTTGPEFEEPVNSPCSLPGANCKPWELGSERDTQFMSGFLNESLGIAGAPINVYKLLGVHEQGKLIDVTGNGRSISNGDLPGFPSSNAFDVFSTEWRSIQKGNNVVVSAFVGYDFGEIKRLDNSPRMYGIEANVRKHIMAFAIKQSASKRNRITKARLERSDDNQKWYGVTIVNLPDDDCLNTILTKHSVPSRYWRLRPLNFNGGEIDYWGVQAFQMFHNYQATHRDNIQDKVLLENRNRDYSLEPLAMKGYYDLIEVQSELSKFGIELPGQTINMRIPFALAVAVLGRPIVVGDIIEIPSEAQYTGSLEKVLKWMEVTDVAWSSEGYTPGWKPTLLSVMLQPAMVTEETQDLFGDLKDNPVEDGLGLVDRNDGNDKFFQDYFDAGQTALAEAKDNVPEKGAEGSSVIRQWENHELEAAKAQGLPNLQKVGLNPRGLYVEDAMPPNNAPFIETIITPTTINNSSGGLPSSASNGEYCRVTYSGFSDNPPARLYRYSEAKGRWVYLETDRRALHNPEKPTMQEFLVSPNRKPFSKITK